MSPVPRVECTERDLAILRELFHCRVMTLAQVAALRFDGRVKAAAKRLRTLKRRALVAERPRLPQQPSVLYITKRGYTTVKDCGALIDYPEIGWEFLKKRIQVSPFTLAHELSVMDARVAIETAIRGDDRLAVAEFSTWPRLFQFRARLVGGAPTSWMRPDAFVRVHERQTNGAIAEHLFYAEVDRSTEVLDVLRAKAAAYLDHYQSGGLASRSGRPRDEYRRFPFRVLWVFRNAERRNNAAAAFCAHRPPILTQAWMTTADELRADPLGPIWVRPIDYRDAIRGTEFDPSSVAAQLGYRRRSSREVLVEQVVRKQAIFAGHPIDGS